MEMPKPIEFTDQERYVLSFIRAGGASGAQSQDWQGVAAFFISLACGIAAVVRDDWVLAFVAYGLIAWRVWFALTRTNTWGSIYREIFRKYDVKIQEFAGAFEQLRTGSSGPNDMTERKPPPI